MVIQKRRTVQKSAIEDALLRARGHVSAEELHLLVRKHLPKVSIGTIYRNLKSLVEEGKALKVIAPDGVLLFEPVSEKHHHLRCLSCNKVVNFSIDAGMMTDADRQRMETIERKMERRTEGTEGEMMLYDESKMMFPNEDDGMFPPEGDMYYDDGEYNNGMYNDGAVPLDESTHYDNEMFPPEREIYYDETMPTDGMYPSEGEIYYDETIPSNEVYEEPSSIETDAPTNQSKGLFQPLFDQIEQFFANVSLFIEF